MCAVALAGIVFPAAAQEDRKDKNLNREMTLEREYDPSVQDASKINSLPPVKDPEIKKRPIEYARFTWPVEPEKEIGLLGSGRLQTELPVDKRRGYLNFGIGNYLNLNGDAGYHILNTEKDRLQVLFSHRSTNGKIKLLTPDGVESLKSKAKLNDNLGSVRFAHEFDKASFGLGAQYGYSAFDYYGYFPGMNPDNMLTRNQGNQLIALNAGVRSRDLASFNYLFDLDFRNFSHKYAMSPEIDGVKENTFGARLDLNAAFDGTKKVGLGAKFDYFSYTFPSGFRDDFTGFDNHAEVTLNPYFAVAGTNWNVKLGANVMFITGSDSKMAASPDITADVQVADATVLYGNFLGAVQANSVYEIARENRYADPTQGVRASRTWFDGTIGIKSGVAPGFWFDIFAGYKITSDDHFFLPFYSDGIGTWGNVGRPVYFDSKLFRVGATFKYSFQQWIDLSLKGVYNAWDVSATGNEEDRLLPESDYKAYNKPDLEIEAGVTVKPVERLAVGLAYYWAGGRYTWAGSAAQGAVKMKNINELNLNGSYALTDAFGVYVQLNNLLGRKYDLFPGYTTQGFQVLAGLNFNF